MSCLVFFPKLHFFSFTFLFPYSKTLGLYTNEKNVALVNHTLESLTEYCQGQCPKNQVTIKAELHVTGAIIQEWCARLGAGPASCSCEVFPLLCQAVTLFLQNIQKWNCRLANDTLHFAFLFPHSKRSNLSIQAL